MTDDRWRDGECKLYTRKCRTCDRDSLSLEDGECEGCRGDAEYQYEMTRRANEAARPRGYRNAANVLLRLADEKGIDPTFKAVLLEEAGILSRKAS